MTDVETGYKAFRGDIIRNMRFSSSGFGFEIEVTARISKLKCRIYEVPISYHGRTYEEGKKITFWDGLSAFTTCSGLTLSVDLSRCIRECMAAILGYRLSTMTARPRF